MAYYYDLINTHTGEYIYECDKPFDTCQDALIDAKKTLITISEALCRIFTTPPGRSSYEEPQMESVIGREFESDVPKLDTKMMLAIHSAVCDAVAEKGRTLTPVEIDEIILGVSGWDASTDVGAEYLAEAFAKVEDRKSHIAKEPKAPELERLEGESVEDFQWRVISSQYDTRPER